MGVTKVTRNVDGSDVDVLRISNSSAIWPLVGDPNWKRLRIGIRGWLDDWENLDEDLFGRRIFVGLISGGVQGPFSGACQNAVGLINGNESLPSTLDWINNTPADSMGWTSVSHVTRNATTGSFDTTYTWGATAEHVFQWVGPAANVVNPTVFMVEIQRGTAGPTSGSHKVGALGCNNVTFDDVYSDGEFRAAMEADTLSLADTALPGTHYDEFGTNLINTGNEATYGALDHVCISMSHTDPALFISHFAVCKLE